MHILTDIGGTNMRVACAKDGTIGDVQKVKTPKDPEEAIGTFVEIVGRCVGGERVESVTGCVAGSVSAEGVISEARNLRAWEGVNIIAELSTRLGSPVKIVNDAALAGLGEFRYGAGRGSLALSYVTVSTGVGGGWIVDGSIRDSTGVATIDIDGEDLEDLISGTAVARRYSVEPKELADLETRINLADTLARGLEILLERWPSDTIVIGGSMIVGKNPIPIDRVRTSLSALRSEAPQVKMAELADSGGLWGALALTEEIG